LLPELFVISSNVRCFILGPFSRCCHDLLGLYHSRVAKKGNSRHQQKEAQPTVTPRTTPLQQEPETSHDGNGHVIQGETSNCGQVSHTADDDEVTRLRGTSAEI
jgi:hypothetical protein